MSHVLRSDGPAPSNPVPGVLRTPELPNGAPPLRERRNAATRAALISRIRGEFDEMPGTSLTLPQATRLFGLPIEICRRILSGLVDEGRLGYALDGRYRRRVHTA